MSIMESSEPNIFPIIIQREARIFHIGNFFFNIKDFFFNMAFA